MLPDTLGATCHRDQIRTTIIFTLTIRPDGTHVAEDYQDHRLDFDELTEILGGRPYIEPLAEDVDAVTGESVGGLQSNPWATAIAWAFGKDSHSYRGQVVITGGRDRRGRILGLRQLQVEALTGALKALQSKHEAGLPLTLNGPDLVFLEAFTLAGMPALSADAQDPKDDQAPKTSAGLIGVICLAVGVLLGGGAAWLLLSVDAEEEPETVTEETEEAADEEAEAAAEDLAQREAEIEAYEDEMEDLDERESELDSRAESLDERESEADDRESALEGRESEADTREAELDEREDDLDERQEDLEDAEDQQQAPDEGGTEDEADEGGG